MTQEQYAVGCTRERDAAARFYQLKGQVLEDQNALRALGVDRTADQLDAMADRMGDQQRDMQEAFNFKKLLADAALHKLNEAAEEMARRGAAMTISRTEAIAKTRTYANTPIADAWNRALNASNPLDKTVTIGGSQMHEFAVAARATQGLVEHIQADDVNALDRYFNSAEGLATAVAPEVAVPLKGVHLLADLGRLGLNAAEVSRLLELNDAQLAKLGQLTQQMKVDADRLHQTRLDLQQAQAAIGGSCDSTKLVKADPAPQTPPPPTTPVEKPAVPKKPVKPVHHGMSAGTEAALGIGAAAAGVGVAYAASQAQSCGSGPSTSDADYRACYNNAVVGNCLGVETYCARWGDAIAKWCDCNANGDQSIQSLCDQLRENDQELRDVGGCRAPLPMTPAQPPISRRR